MIGMLRIKSILWGWCFLFLFTQLHAVEGDHPKGPGDRRGSYSKTDYDPTDHGLGWFMYQCTKKCKDDPCCTEECRHRYCIKTHKISSQVFPPECRPTVNSLNDCRKENPLPGGAPVPEAKEDEQNAQSCPYLWEVTFKQTGTHNSNRCWGEGLEAWQVSEVDGYARFTNVLIYTPDPTEMPNMSSEQWRACRFRHKDFMESEQRSVDKTYYLMYGGDEVIDADTATLQANETTGKISVLEYDGDGVSLKEFREIMAQFRSPHSRRSFSLSGKCGKVYFFKPIAVDNK